MTCQRCGSNKLVEEIHSEKGRHVCMMCGFPNTKEDDMVNHPKHYTQGKYETIDVILDITQQLPGPQGYLVGNIIKYLSRYHFKNGKQDLEKARWYLNKLLEIMQEDLKNAK